MTFYPWNWVNNYPLAHYPSPPFSFSSSFLIRPFIADAARWIPMPAAVATPSAAPTLSAVFSTPLNTGIDTPGRTALIGLKASGQPGPLPPLHPYPYLTHQLILSFQRMRGQLAYVFGPLQPIL